MTTTTDKMRENLRRYRERLQGIRDDRDLSAEAKARYANEEYAKARRRHDELAEEHRAGVSARLEETRKAALSAPRISGADAALSAMSYRDALDRASKTADPRDLSGMLYRAETVGDEALARAILHRGYELQNEHLVGAYLDKYPKHREAWDSFMDAAVEQNRLEALGSEVPAPEMPRDLDVPGPRGKPFSRGNLDALIGRASSAGGGDAA